MYSKSNFIDIKIEDIKKFGDKKCFRKFGVSAENISVLASKLEYLQKDRIKNGGRKPKYPVLLKLIMFLTRIKKNYSFEDLSSIFKISTTRCHEITEEYLKIFNKFDILPSKANEIINNIKQSKNNMIVDSTIFQINKPSVFFLNIFQDLKKNMELK